VDSKVLLAVIITFTSMGKLECTFRVVSKEILHKIDTMRIGIIK